MENTLSNKYAGWIGLGLLYMWGCAIVAWMDYWNSYETWMKVLAFLGGVLVSISGTAIAIYTSKLEEKIRQLKERSKNSEMEGEYWKEQAQVAINFLEKERKIG